MTDIVERLEQRYEQTAEPECDLIQEAALVIDRLRDELTDVRADAALLRAEIERLQALAPIVREQGFELERLRAKIERWEAQSIAQYAEINRLRAALQDIERNTGPTMLATNHGRRGDMANEIARHTLEQKP